jgi:lipopolysaccharide biosynthesis glycosyltransferase
MPTQNALFVSTSQEYFKYFSVFIRSLLKNYPDYPNLIVAWQNFTQKQQEYLNVIPRVHSLDLDTVDFTAGPAMFGREWEDPKIYYARLLIFSELFEDYDSILYLDMDTVILKPLDGLFKLNSFTIFQESYQGEHPIINSSVDPEGLAELMKVDNLPPLPPVAANAGVFLAPLSVRTKANFQSLMDIKERYREYLIWADQSVLNLWMLKNGYSAVLDYRYNFQAMLVDQRRAWDAFRDVYLLHFNGMVVTHHLELLMNLGLSCWRIPLVGRWIYFLFQRFFFTQNTVRFPRLNPLLSWLGKRFGTPTAN